MYSLGSQTASVRSSKTQTAYEIQMAGPHPRVSDSVGLWRGWRTGISKRFPSETDTAGLETTL